MSLREGQSLTHYEILGLLGAGGMGEVYLARDTRLDREVAIKVLPDAFSEDRERLRRFEREAKTLASLSHANIAAIHGLDTVDGTTFIAMELVPGEDLESLLERGPMPLDEALDICRQIAEGLEAAHEAGIVHRDLKPANVLITPDGVTKILDFGLAKPTTQESDPDSVRTIGADSVRVTEEGVVLGTPTYMSPEQARGKAVDRRTDIWAFGCVLYECLAGTRAFHGNNFGDVMASVISKEPDWGAVPDIPPRVETLLRRCLVKDPRSRLRDAGEARIALEAARRPSSTTAPAPSEAGEESKQKSGERARLAIAVAVALALGLGGGAMFSGGDPVEPVAPDSSASSGATATPPKRVVATVASLPIGSQKPAPQISPDGTHVAWMQDSKVWVRRLDALAPKSVAEEVENAFDWSPDSRQVAYIANSELWRVSIEDLTRVRVADLDSGARTIVDWASEEYIHAAGFDTVLQFPVAGGEPTVVLRIEEGKTGDHWHLLRALPGGRGIVGAFHDIGEPFQSIEWFHEGERKALLELPGGRLGQLHIRADGALLIGASVDGSPNIWTAKIDLDAVALEDEPRVLIRNATSPSRSADGTLVYIPNAEDSVPAQLAWLDVNSKAITAIGDTRPKLRQASLSPSHRHIVLVDRSGGNSIIRVLDLERGVEIEIGELDDFVVSPIWLPDGRFLVSAMADGGTTLVSSVSGRQALEPYADHVVMSVSPDGRYESFMTLGGAGTTWGKLTDTQTGASVRLSEAGRGQMILHYSPDSAWAIYAVVNSNRRETFLCRLPPEEGAHWHIATTTWGKAWFTDDMSAIYYESDGTGSGPSTLHRVALTREPEVRLGAPEVVMEFDARTTFHDFDGFDRFLVITKEEKQPDRIVVDTAWTEDD